MNTLNMVPVSWLKEIRVDPAPGDGACSSEFSLGWSSADDELYQRDPAHYDDWFITSFADRLNTGKQPVGDNVSIDAKCDCGSVYDVHADYFKWALESDNPLKTWKPNFDSMLADYKKTQKIKANDPVCTQAMLDDGYPLTTGMGCLVLNTKLGNATYEKATIDFIGKFSCVYTSESCQERIASVDDLLFKSIESDKEKAIDEAMEDLGLILSMGVKEIVRRLIDKGYRKVGE